MDEHACGILQFAHRWPFDCLKCGHRGEIAAAAAELAAKPLRCSRCNNVHSKAIERGFPHIVEIAVPPGGLGRRLDAMHDWHQKKALRLATVAGDVRASRTISGGVLPTRRPPMLSLPSSAARSSSRRCQSTIRWR